MAHARHVARLTTRLFDVLLPVHTLPSRLRELAGAGAMLHNVGVVVDEPNHHRVGRDIIMAAALQGFDPAERAMLACMVAFHRKSVQPAGEPLYTALTPQQQQHTLALSAVLRVADGLDYSQTQSTEFIEDDLRSVTRDWGQASGANPQPLISFRVHGPQSHDDAARAMKKADLWATLFPPLRITGCLTSPGITPDDTLAAAGRRILRYQAQSLTASEWRADDGVPPKPRMIHDWRVTTRRLRSTLRIFKTYYKSKAVEPVLKGARDMALALAFVREWDIPVSALKQFQQTCDAETRQGAQPILDDWRAARKAARADLMIYLQGDRQARWFEQFTMFLQTDAHDRAPELGHPHYLRHASDAIIAQHIADVRAYDTLPDSPAVDHIHALRIAVKRLRYVTDALRDVLPAPRAEQVIAACTAAQAEYGLIHDAHLIAARALNDVAQRRAGSPRVDPPGEARIRGALAFARAQQGIVEEHLPGWRKYLEPLLVL